MKLIECVPNFSEGRDRAVIDAIAAEIAASPGAVLLDVDPGAATNRTVVTFIGEPDAVEEAAFRAIKKAAATIDMTRHRGEHPRLGATDVCPFVPVAGATMEDCVEIAKRLGKRVGEELGIPVYLYEAAATRPERKSLADIRKGEYEALADRMKDASFAPDFGPARFNPRSGATVIGAREFLIAYNVNLNTRDKKLANAIAGALREAGTSKRGADGTTTSVPGRFKECRAVGWYIEEFGRAQISINLTNYKVTPLHEVFDAACEEAAKLGLRVTGSELVGLIPREALLAAGDHYLAKQGKTNGVPEKERVHVAVLSLGLSELGPFTPSLKVIEYRYAGGPSGLVAMPLRDFADELSSHSPAPGGGSVAALCGALSASLTAMVAALTWSKAGMEAARPAMRDHGHRGAGAEGLVPRGGRPGHRGVQRRSRGQSPAEEDPGRHRGARSRRRVRQPGRREGPPRRARSDDSRARALAPGRKARESELGLRCGRCGCHGPRGCRGGGAERADQRAVVDRSLGARRVPRPSGRRAGPRSRPGRAGARSRRSNPAVGRSQTWKSDVSGIDSR